MCRKSSEVYVVNHTQVARIKVKSKQLDSLKPRVMVMICGSGLKGVTHVHDVNNAIRVN